jgi:hypothetical protein
MRIVSPIILLLVLEVAVLLVAWRLARRRDYRVERRRTICPLTGERTTLQLAGNPHTHAITDVLACSLLDRSGVRACDRSCLRALQREVQTCS